MLYEDINYFYQRAILIFDPKNEVFHYNNIKLYFYLFEYHNIHTKSI